MKKLLIKLMAFAVIPAMLTHYTVKAAIRQPSIPDCQSSISFEGDGLFLAMVYEDVSVTCTKSIIQKGGCGFTAVWGVAEWNHSTGRYDILHQQCKSESVDCNASTDFRFETDIRISGLDLVPGEYLFIVSLYGGTCDSLLKTMGTRAFTFMKR